MAFSSTLRISLKWFWGKIYITSVTGLAAVGDREPGPVNPGQLGSARRIVLAHVTE